jgi:hypothetical protein
VYGLYRVKRKTDRQTDRPAMGSGGEIESHRKEHFSGQQRGKLNQKGGR